MTLLSEAKSGFPEEGIFPYGPHPADKFETFRFSSATNGVCAGMEEFYVVSALLVSPSTTKRLLIEDDCAELFYPNEDPPQNLEGKQYLIYPLVRDPYLSPLWDALVECDTDEPDEILAHLDRHELYGTGPIQYDWRTLQAMVESAPTEIETVTTAAAWLIRRHLTEHRNPVEDAKERLFLLLTDDWMPFWTIRKILCDIPATTLQAALREGRSRASTDRAAAAWESRTEEGGSEWRLTKP